MADSTGWQGSKEAGWRYYTSEDEYVTNDWKQVDGNWYCFEHNGCALLDCWAYIRGKLYHFDASGHMEKNKWISCGEHVITEYDGYTTYTKIMELPQYKGVKDWRYVGSDGAACVGWKKIGGTWYHFCESKDSYNGKQMGAYGLMSYGWLEDYDGSEYCFDCNGKLITGWLKGPDGKWYYISGYTALCNCSGYFIDDKYYDFDENGACLTPNGKPMGICVIEEYRDI